MAFAVPSYLGLPQGRLAYREVGEGPPLVLLHGIPTSSLLWHDVAPRLTGFRVIAPDLLGYGASDKPADADLSVAAQTGYVEALLNALGVARAVIVGHDIGGGVAQLLALRRPGLVERLVLIDSIAWDSWPVPDIARLKEPGWDETMQRLDLSRGFRRAFERGIAHKERVTDELVARYVDPFRDLEGRMAYLRAARALDPADLLAVSGRLGSITAPALILWGEQDDYQLPEWGPKLAAALPNARLVTLPDAAHFVPEDAPEQVADLIARFARGE